MPNAALLLVAAAAATLWAHLGASRAGERAAFAARAVLGGAAAFGLALLAYEAATRAGLEVRWETMERADSAAFLLAVIVGLLEEGAKLTGILLVVERGVRTRTALAAAVGVSAGFASFETLVMSGGEPSIAAFARAAFGPMAHALLVVPCALAVAPALRSRRPAAILAAPLLASSALHGAGDLSLATSGLGQAGYALTLAAPALMLYARTRRRRATSAAIPTWK